MSKILVILNPAAHSARAAGESDRLGTLPGSPDLAFTTEPGSARALAAGAAAQGYDTVVAAGGDGTVNEIVNGLAGSGLALGVLPAGTMNVFAAELGLPTDLAQAWEVIRRGHAREIDLAKANQQYFVQLAGIGFDAQIVKETSWAMKRDLGPLSYVISAAQVAARKPPRLVVQCDDRTFEGCFVLIGNGRYYGGPVTLFPEARVDDGLLDALVFQKMSYLDVIRYLGNILMGSHTDLPDVISCQARRIEVTSDDPVPVEVDGELAMELPVTFGFSSKKLRVLVP
ncbi:MAG TPA: diacylglycerol kinase family protein [Chthoniobacteraceae bacterium]|jgi:YegS/Rv2252/BmrU family lipid kinase|nr:diacylglycerol kinase family protein [Chthoniobacteraceae bacterium]